MFYKNQYSGLTPDELFWEKVNKGGKRMCWNWMGAIGSTGYGFIRCGKNVKMAHRVSWEIYFNKIPKNKCVLHRCDNRKCVNPSHLFLGTKKDNVMDAIRKKRVPQLTGNNWKLTN